MTQETDVDNVTELIVDDTGRPEPTDIFDIVDDLMVNLHEAKNDATVFQCFGRSGAIPWAARAIARQVFRTS